MINEDIIKRINEKCPYNQGIFKEPFGIPSDIKEPVIYTRWASGGRDGSCWDDENTINEDWTNDRPSDAYKVLDLLLEEIKPNISALELRSLLGLWNSNQETDYGYYGDYTEETIEWILLSDILKILKLD